MDVVNFDANNITISGGNTNLSGTPTGFSSRLQFNDDTVLSSFVNTALPATGMLFWLEEVKLQLF